MTCRAAVVWPARWWVGTVAIFTNEAVRTAVRIAATTGRRLAESLCAVAACGAVSAAATCTVGLAGTADTAAAIFTAGLVRAVGVHRTSTEVVEI